MPIRIELLSHFLLRRPNYPILTLNQPLARSAHPRTQDLALDHVLSLQVLLLCSSWRITGQCDIRA
jgi:hypothetical protein